MRRSRRLQTPEVRLPGKRLGRRTTRNPRAVPGLPGGGVEPERSGGGLTTPPPPAPERARRARLRRAERRGLESPELTIVADERVAEQAKERARKLVLRVAAVAPRPVLHGRIVLNQQADPAHERPAVVKASLDVGGRPVHARAAARQMLDAIDLLERRLRHNVEGQGEIGRVRRRETRAALPGARRRGGRPSEQATDEHHRAGARRILRGTRQRRPERGS